MPRLLLTLPLLALLAVSACAPSGDGTPQAAWSAPAVSATSPSPSPSADPLLLLIPSPVVTGPQVGTGVFRTADGGGPAFGAAGVLRTYVVEVEEGITAFDVAGFATAVDEILADHRSWTAGRQWRLQRVAPGGRADFRVRLATPPTVDAVCGRGGMQTNGIFSCRTGENVMINLMRWTSGTPDYGTALEAYRQMVINHEVGHFLGHGHSTCPGRGKVAPVMMQQTKGLNGCLANSFPYPDGVTYLR
jgi:hypothetical protein